MTIEQAIADISAAQSEDDYISFRNKFSAEDGVNAWDDTGQVYRVCVAEFPTGQALLAGVRDGTDFAASYEIIASGAAIPEDIPSWFSLHQTDNLEEDK